MWGKYNICDILLLICYICFNIKHEQISPYNNIQQKQEIVTLLKQSEAEHAGN